MKKLLLTILLAFSLEGATISKATYNKLQKASKFLEEEKYSEAKKLLNEILQGKANTTGKSYAYQSLASIAADKEDYKQVAIYYQKILELSALKPEDLERISFSLSQVYLSLEEYKKSISLATKLLGSKVVDQKTLKENLALAYYYNKEFKNTISFTKEVITYKKEKESWYRLLYSSYIELKEYKNAIATLKTMVKLYDNENYWIQLASLYSETKQTKNALATLDLAFKKNLITNENNLLYYISLLLQHDLFNKPAEILEEKMKNGKIKTTATNFELLINAHLNAKNYSKVITLITKSEYAKVDKYKLIKGDILYNQSRYKEAIAVLKDHKFKKEKIKGESCTLIALCYYNLENKTKSKEFLKRASLVKSERKRAKNIAKELGFRI